MLDIYDANIYSSSMKKVRKNLCKEKADTAALSLVGSCISGRKVRESPLHRKFVYKDSPGLCLSLSISHSRGARTCYICARARDGLLPQCTGIVAESVARPARAPSRRSFSSSPPPRRHQQQLRGMRASSVYFPSHLSAGYFLLNSRRKQPPRELPTYLIALNRARCTKRRPPDFPRFALRIPCAATPSVLSRGERGEELALLYIFY